MAKLSSPFDPSKHLPWDCLDNMAVSVEGCMVNLVSLVNTSTNVFNFSCSWLQYQGSIRDENTARLSAWIRPSAVARYLLRHTDLGAAANDINAPPKPADWQEILEEMLRDWGSALVADASKPKMVVLSQMRQSDRQCNTTFEVVSGGILGVGEVNRSSLGMIVMPAGRPHRQPFLIKGERPWASRIRAWRALFIALIVIISVLGALLLAGIGFLAYRLITASKRKAGPLRGCPFEDGLAHVPARQQDIGGGASSLEIHSRRNGAIGDI